jgi:hypothetical protein
LENLWRRPSVNLYGMSLRNQQCETASLSYGLAPVRHPSAIDPGVQRPPLRQRQGPPTTSGLFMHQGASPCSQNGDWIDAKTHRQDGFLRLPSRDGGREHRSRLSAVARTGANYLTCDISPARRRNSVARSCGAPSTGSFVIVTNYAATSATSTPRRSATARAIAPICRSRHRALRAVSTKLPTLEYKLATHALILAWRAPRCACPGGGARWSIERQWPIPRCSPRFHTLI